MDFVGKLCGISLETSTRYRRNFNEISLETSAGYLWLMKYLWKLPWDIFGNRNKIIWETFAGYRSLEVAVGYSVACFWKFPQAVFDFLNCFSKGHRPSLNCAIGYILIFLNLYLWNC